jgi:hypothetical protein
MILLKLNESNASLRVVPLPSLLSASATTSAATNESGRTFYFSIGGVNYGSGGSLSAVSEAMGMYTCNFSASKISVSGPGFVYYGLPTSSLTALAVSAPFMVVPVDSYDSMRFGMFALPNAAPGAADGLVAFGTGTGQLHVSSGSVGLKGQVHSDVTIKGIENYANISNVTLHAGTHSNVTIQGVTRLNSNVTLNADTHSGATIQGLSNYANISNVTLHAGTHSGATVQGVSNYANFPMTSVATSVWSTLRSNFTTPGSFGEYTYSQVTGISSGTVFGITDTSNFPSGSGATAGEVARAVWANSGRTLDGTSTATIFIHPRSVWSTLRSDYTTPGSFGEYVYSQVTGTSSGTVQGVTRVNSGVTLNADTHSGATIQGVTRVNSGVTLNADTHSGATIAGIVSGGIIAATLASGVITTAKFAAGAIDAAALATDAGQEIADRFLSRNIETGSDTGRLVRHALAPLRNKVLIEGSTGTVYAADDSTSIWTFSVVTGTHPINSVDPIG